jgi:hypothetical protein
MQLADPIGEISLAEENLRITLAACARVLTWLNVSSSAAALERIFPCGVPAPPVTVDGVQPDAYTVDEITSLRPFILVWSDENNGLVLSREAAPATIDASGMLYAAFEMNVLPELRPHAAALDRQFKNDIGVIGAQLLQFYQGPYLIADKVHIQGPWRVHPDDEEGQGDHLVATMKILYGTRRTT